jgi:Icc-related predicted phosphoesterase
MLSLSNLVIKRLPHDASPERVVAAAAWALAALFLLLLSVVWRFYGLLPAAVTALGGAFLSARWVYWNAEGVLGWRARWLHSSSALVASLTSEPKQQGTLRVVCLSDTHGKHRNVQHVPEGDVLLHCGDFTHRGTHAEIKDFNAWLGSLPHQHKIVVAGNHDFCMDAAEYDANWRSAFRHAEYNDPNVSRELLTNATYLENRSLVVDGVKFYGSPMTPPIPGRTMAFNVARGFAAQQHWAKLPVDVDVLVTHGPPNGILDKTVTGLRVGDEMLLKEVVSRVRPRFHVFGHIHEAYGATRVGNTTFVNCATSTLLGRPRHPPVVIDVPTKC